MRKVIGHQRLVARVTKKERGYTLIEILIYSSILALFLLITTQLFIAVKNANANSTALVVLQGNLRQITSDLTQTIRGASNVANPLPGSSANSLSLNDGAILYQLSGGVLEKVEGGQTWSLSSDEVTISGLSFENVVEATQTATLRVKMNVESNYLLEGGRTLSEGLETTVSLR